ncbi:MAG: hypothetical protein KBB50_04155, partial [Candidatus Pacebacteria bacterium]|nr:hypothetical protein [Candidatus Paceibacterota bacterium]
MLRNLIKKISTSILILILFLQSGSPFAFFELAKSIHEYHKQSNIVDKIYIAKQNKNVVDSFGYAQKAYAAINSAENEYMLDIGPVNGSTAANYVFTSFFNPSGSGRTASIKRIAVRSNTASSTASTYVNLTVRRISTASAGTQVLASNFPQKNASSSASIIEVRHTGVTVSFSGTVDSRILGQPQSGAVGTYFSNRDIAFNQNDENIIIQPGEGIAVYQEAAGTLTSRVRVFIEWEESTSAPSPQDEFLFAYPRVEVAATANYVYNSFFNPVASGKTAVVKRIWFGTETCDAAARYTNNIVVKRISAASGGTAITATNVPKKHTGSANSVMDFRRTGVTVTQVGGANARIGHVTPCGTTGQFTGWQRLDFHDSDEKLILQQGEGIALLSEAVGDVDQFVRMIIEWDEVAVASTPASQGEYIFSSDKVASSTAVNTTLYSFFNPSGSGKTAIIKRLAIRANATNTATYTSYQFRRLSTVSGGTLVTATDLPKKHTGTANSVMEMRWCLQTCASQITANYIGTTDAKLLSVTGAGAIGQTIGQGEIVFGNNEELILKPGEGIGLYHDVLASSVSESVKILIEWDEEVSTPSAQNEYIMSIGPINGSTATSYNYMSFFNPISSGKTAVIKRVAVRVDTVNTAGYIPIQLRRITTSSAGTVIASSSYPKKHTDSATSSMEIRRTGTTVTYAGAATSKLMVIQTPGAVASAIAGNTGYKENIFSNSEFIVLKPGEGIVLYQNPTAGDADLRVRLLLEWSEVASAPTALGEYMMAIGPINQSLTSNYVYTTFLNPINSAKNYILRKIGVQVNRSAAATNPTYNSATIRKISTASGGTLVATTSLQKNTGTASSTAEVRSTGVTATLLGVADSRIFGVTMPGVVNQIFGEYENSITGGDELILKPGEGIALFQEQANGDANSRYHLFVEWDEEGNAPPAQSITFSVSTTTLYFGQSSSVSAKYASSTNPSGSNVDVEAHTISVSTNAVNGYMVSVQGQTLTSVSGVTVQQIGAIATTSLIGTEQFGIRLVASGGSGTSTSPYNG